MSIANTIFHSVGHLLVLSVAFVAMQNLFILMKSLFPLPLETCLARSCFGQSQREYNLCSVLGFWWVPVSHVGLISILNLIFVCGVRRWSSLILLACGCPVFPTPFIGMTIFCCIGHSFLLCPRLVDHSVEGPFLGSLFCSMDLCVCFCANTILSWWWELCHRAWSPELWCHQLWFSFSTFLWLFEVFPGSIQILGLFVPALKKCWWYFDRDCVECIDCSGKHRHFNCICSSNPWAWKVFPFLWVVLSFSHKCSIVFRVLIPCLFGWVYS